MGGATWHRAILPCIGAWARQATIGFLGRYDAQNLEPVVKAFEQALREKGWIDGYNVVIEYRWAEVRKTATPSSPKSS